MELPELGSCRVETPMVNPPNPETARHLHEHLAVIDIEDIFGGGLGGIQGQPVEVLIRLSKMDKRRADEKINQLLVVQREKRV